jgi:3-isopropylmalate dehydrogenase
VPEVFKILALPGDGIGPEIVESALSVFEVAREGTAFEVEIETALIGGAATKATGVPLPDATLDAARASSAILLGAVGTPEAAEWEPEVRPERGLLKIRKELGLFANLRPVRSDLAPEGSPLRPERGSDIDMLFVRELTGGIYFGEPRERGGEGRERYAIDTMRYSAWEVERIARLGFAMARKRRRKLCSVDKANVLASSALWREVVDELAPEYEDVQLEHRLVDACAMQILTEAHAFDVIVTSNLFGDILSDEASVLAGSLGLMPSASVAEVDDSGLCFGLYEPIHGSAPDIAGKGIANPIGTIASVAMMLRWSAGQFELADRIDAAVRAAVVAGVRTGDIAAPGQAGATTQEFTDAVISELRRA